MKKIGIMALMMVLLLGSVYAFTCTVVTPATSARAHGATQLFNVTTSDATVDNCSVTISSAKTGDSTTFYVYNATGGNYANATHTTVTLDDANDYTVAASCSNATTDVTCTGTTAVVVDNTDPACTFAALLVSDETYSSDQKWQVTCTNALAATLQFGTNPKIGMVYSNDVCTYTGNKLSVPQGTYQTVTVITTDYTNTTTCTLTDVVIDEDITPTEIGALVGDSNQEITTQSTGTVNKNVVFVVIGGLVLIWWLRKKK